MSRYIETEYIGRTINHLPTRYVQAERDETAIDIVVSKIDIAEAIASAPSIDIVRCQDCKWAKANGTYQWCGRLDSTARITADDFCSYGEREGE
jgi:hypothetical protein